MTQRGDVKKKKDLLEADVKLNLKSYSAVPEKPRLHLANVVFKKQSPRKGLPGTPSESLALPMIYKRSAPNERIDE